MPDTAIFAPMQARTLNGDILDLLTEAILSGKVKPGERINESQLARQLKVSRAPIREALRQLEEQGLAVNRPRYGMFVVSLEDEDYQKINSIRLILEAEALRLARANLKPTGERRLNQLVEKMEKMEPAPAVQAIRLDLEFHRTIWSFGGNEYLERTLNSLTAPLFACALLFRPKDEKLRMILDSHRPLLEFVQGKRKESAEEVMLHHLKLRWTQPAHFSSYADRR